MTTCDVLRADAHACLRVGLAAVEPARLVARVLARDGTGLVLQAPDGGVIARHRGPVRLVGAGKAAAAMARAAAAVVADALVAGVVVAPAVEDVPHVRVLTGAHPVPDASSVAATAELLALA